MNLLIFLATFLVYRYEIAYQEEVRPQGTGNSGYMEFLTPCGEGVFSEVIYDFRVTSLPSPAYGFDPELGQVPLPVIPSRTYSLSDGIINSFDSLFQTINWDGIDVGGEFYINFYNPGQSWLRVSVPNIDNFWPLEYIFNQSSMPSQWLFTGTRKVPDSGTTFAYVLLSCIGLWFIRRIR